MDIDFPWLILSFVLSYAIQKLFCCLHIFCLTRSMFCKENLQFCAVVFVFVLNCKYCNTCFSIDLKVFCPPLWCENGRLIFMKKNCRILDLQYQRKKPLKKILLSKAFILFKTHFSRIWAYTWSRGHVIWVYVHVLHQ